MEFSSDSLFYLRSSDAYPTTGRRPARELDLYGEDLGFDCIFLL
jgi:hypothetical protein